MSWKMLLALVVILAAVTAPAMAQCCGFGAYVVSSPAYYAAPVYYASAPVVYSAPVASVYVGLQPPAYAYYPAPVYSVGFGWGGRGYAYSRYDSWGHGRGGFSSGGRHHR